MESDKKTDVTALTEAFEAAVMKPASAQTDDPKVEAAPQRGYNIICTEIRNRGECLCQICKKL